MPSVSTLELAQQGEPSAIALILNDFLSQHHDATASVIRLGNYLSVFIEVPLAADQGLIVGLVSDMMGEFKIDGISTVEINARQRGDRAIGWTQTLETPFHITPSSSGIRTMSNPASDQSSSAPETAEVLLLPKTAIVPETSVQQKVAQDEWNPSLHAVLQRPEIVAMVAIALMLVVWDAYIEWMAEEAQFLSGRQLALRLGVSSSTISRYKERLNFSEWSQTLDPEGIAWIYTGKAFVRKL
jgi:hypothetical protein